MNFEFATASRIIFGSGVIEQAGSFASRLGRKACLVTGSTPARAASFRQRLRREKIKFITLPVRGEPTTNGVLELVAHARKAGCDLVIGLGGGSVLDTGKVLAALLTNRGNPLTDAICREGLKLSARSLLRVYRDGADAGAREEMSLAALLGGMALANAGLGAVHGLAGPLGGMFPAPHGAICARLLPEVMKINLQALEERVPESAALSRYREAARIITGNPRAAAADGVAWVCDLCEALEIPPLSSFGVERGDLAAVAEKAEKSSSMKGNPLLLTGDELLHILRRAL